MAESINISRLRGPSTLLRYGLAVLAVSAATIIQQFGDEHFAVTPSYFCAVLLTAWLGGLGPAWRNDIGDSYVFGCSSGPCDAESPATQEDDHAVLRSSDRLSSET